MLNFIKVEEYKLAVSLYKNLFISNEEFIWVSMIPLNQKLIDFIW